MHLLNFVFLIVFLIFPGLPLLVVLGVVSAAIWDIFLEEPVERLMIRLNPRCLECHQRTLKRYKPDSSEATAFQYFGCLQCHTHLKRTKRGKWVRLPRGIDSDEEWAKRVFRRANRMERAEETETQDPLGSWIGGIHVGLPTEEWPEFDGVPMLPFCQIRCADLPYLPPILKDVALVCVFMASVGVETVSPHGERWVVRTYANLDDLVPILYPGDESYIGTYPVVWKAEDDTPNRVSDLPEELWIDFVARYGRGGRSHGRSRVGGYGWGDEDYAASLEERQAEFVFQIHIGGGFPWLRCSGGTFFFARSTTPDTDSWFLDCAPGSPTDGSRVMPVHLGCEIEGLQIYIQDRHCRDGAEEMGMSCQGRSGTIPSIRSLRGLVQITTPEMALRFVRLRTCRSMYDPYAEEYEIFTRAEYAALPRWSRIRIPNSSVAKKLTNRMVLDPQSFLQSGFEPAHVEATEGGFLVTRWTYTPPPHYSYANAPIPSFQKIAETVETDGTYTRSVLEQRPVSDDELLRPTHGPDQTNPNELLRPGN